MLPGLPLEHFLVTLLLINVHKKNLSVIFLFALAFVLYTKHTPLSFRRKLNCLRKLINKTIAFHSGLKNTPINIDNSFVFRNNSANLQITVFEKFKLVLVPQV
jgi:uncharacterized Fe-S cluster-containing radical SAM superfamily protein